MAKSQHNNVAEKLLVKLFDRWQGALGQPSRILTLCITGRDGKPYFETKGEARQLLHATLENAEKQGTISLQWGKHAASHEIERILLLDGEKLSEFLGKPSASKCTEKLKAELLPLLNASPHTWIAETLQNACSYWLRGKPFARLSLPQDHLRARQLFMAVLAVANGLHKGLDMRTFSARQLSDSKAFEKLKSSFCTIWATHAGLEDWDNDDLLQTLGIEKEPHPVLLRGALQIQREPLADLSCFQPFVGIPRELLVHITPKNIPAYVLTIENLASFSRYTKEILDDGIIIYTNGYPNPDVQKLLARIDIALPETTPFFHWGDTDVDGIGILCFIAKLTPRHDISPHLMERNSWQISRPLNDLEKKKVGSLNVRNDKVTQLVKTLNISGIPLDSEQENITPAPPQTTIYRQAK
jgi:hypothetical protein